MTNPATQVSSAPAKMTRTVIVTFLGSIVRRMGNWMPIGGTIDLMAEYGLDAPSVRTAVYRLKQRGWLVPEARGSKRGYALSPLALEALSSGDQIIWHARQPAALEDGWCILNFSIPESARPSRHKLRAHLTSLGFGNIGTAMWIAPARMREAAERAIDELDLHDYAAIFIGQYVAGQDLTALLYQSWDLPGIDRRYKDFVSHWRPVALGLEGQGIISPADAFVTYLGVVDQWRKLPFRDPGLPLELLGDEWGGPAATQVFEQLVGLLEGRALAHTAKHW